MAQATKKSPMPRNTWIVQAVSRNASSSPRFDCMIDGATPTSENWFNPMMKTVIRAIIPNASGKRSLVRIRFDPSRST